MSKGDKRIILVDGEAVGAINRVPSEGETRSNMHAGGRPEKVALTERDREICAAIGPLLREKGQIFVGIDVIGDWLTEINVTSPTGLQELERFDGINATAKIWEAIERRRRLMSWQLVALDLWLRLGREAAARARDLGGGGAGADGAAGGAGAAAGAVAWRQAALGGRPALRLAAAAAGGICSGCMAAPIASGRRGRMRALVAALAARAGLGGGAARLPAGAGAPVPGGGRGCARGLGGASRRRLAGRRGSRSAATAPAAGSPSRCCTSCSPRARRRRPACVAFSPWADLTLAGASLARLARRDALLAARMRLAEVRDLYLAGADPRDPRASPRLGRFRGAPPVLIQASRAEILLDDARMMAARLRADGVEVTLDLWDRRAACLAVLPRAGFPRPTPRSTGPRPSSRRGLLKTA